MSENNSRWDEILGIHREYPAAYPFIGGVALVGLGIWIGSLIYVNDTGYGTNLYTEFISIAVTVFIIDSLNRRRDEKRREREHKDRLLGEVCSPNNDTAIEAVHELRANGWLCGENGLLKGKVLVVSELHGIVGASIGVRLNNSILRNANLEKTKLEFAELENAELEQANLEGANLSHANLKKAKLGKCNLKNVNLRGADLTSAILSRADLTGADLLDAKIWGTQFYTDWGHSSEKHLNLVPGKQLILPNGEPALEDTDWSRFTDPEQPDFWRSDDSESPAWRENSISIVVRELRESGTNPLPPPTPPPPPAAADPR